jgi:hypothetical protein
MFYERNSGNRMKKWQLYRSCAHMPDYALYIKEALAPDNILGIANNEQAQSDDLSLR